MVRVEPKRSWWELGRAHHNTGRCCSRRVTDRIPWIRCRNTTGSYHDAWGLESKCPNFLTGDNGLERLGRVSRNGAGDHA